MATQEDDEDEINPFTTMLLTDDQNHQQQHTLNGFATVLDGAPNQQHLLHNHHLLSIQSTVVIRQLPSEGLSFQLWPAATSLISLPDNHLIDPTNSPLSTTLSGSKNHRQLRILELDSSIGIVGIVAAASIGGNATITDLPHVVPNLRFNTEVNMGVVGPTSGAVNVASLRWGHADDMAVIGREFDVILASYVVYHDHLYESLLETLRLMMLVGSEGNNKMVSEPILDPLGHPQMSSPANFTLQMSSPGREGVCWRPTLDSDMA